MFFNGMQPIPKGKAPLREPFLCALCSFYLATFWSKFAMILPLQAINGLQGKK